MSRSLKYDSNFFFDHRHIYIYIYIYIYIWTPRPITLPRSRCACGVIIHDSDAKVDKINIYTQGLLLLFLYLWRSSLHMSPSFEFDVLVGISYWFIFSLPALPRQAISILVRFSRSESYLVVVLLHEKGPSG